MRKSYLFYKLALAASLVMIFQACKKSNDVNNNVVIETPYGLYYADTSGALYNTNDGQDTKPIIFFSDGIPSRAICVSGTNIIWVKANAHVSTDNGKNFNPTYKYVSQFAFGQSTIWNDVAENRVYMAANNLMALYGLVYNDKNGTTGNWKYDDTVRWQFESAFAKKPLAITSLTQLANGKMIAFDATNQRIFSRDNTGSRWVETTHSSSSTSDKLPGSVIFTISHINNTVVATDITGVTGIYYSNDNGTTWAKYSGLPATPLYCAYAPFEQTLLVGTQHLGVYMLNPLTGSFSSVNSGLPTDCTVYSITGKQQLYKNGISYQYIYIGTNKGLYRSQDGGNNWTLMKAGTIVDVY